MDRTAASGSESGVVKAVGLLLFLTLPFPDVNILHHLKLFEVILGIGAPILLLALASGTLRMHGNLLDLAVLAYLFFGLLTVVTGSHLLYESARFYRHMVLVPSLLYFLSRACLRSLSTLRTACIVLFLCSLFPSAVLDTYYLATGIRPDKLYSSVDMISISFLNASALFFWITHRRILRHGFHRWLRIPLILFHSATVLVTMTRAVIGGTLCLPLVASRILRSRTAQRLATAAFLFSIAGMFFVSYSYKEFYGDLILKPHREKTLKRVFDYEKYLEDLKGRLGLWGYSIGEGLKKPLFGEGGYAYSAAFGTSTAHNGFVSTFRASGLVGVLVLLFMVCAAYRNIFSARSDLSPFRVFRSFLFLSFSILILVTLTNDFTGGRIVLFTCFLAMTANLKEFSSLPIPSPESLFGETPRVAYP